MTSRRLMSPGQWAFSPVFPFLLRLGDPGSLALQHQASLELRESREHARRIKVSTWEAGTESCAA